MGRGSDERREAACDVTRAPTGATHHGSTTGAIDETALFYLRSRGVPKNRAIVLMILSFLADALAEVEDESLREDIAERLDAWLTRHA